MPACDWTRGDRQNCAELPFSNKLNGIYTVTVTLVQRLWQSDRRAPFVASETGPILAVTKPG